MFTDANHATLVYTAEEVLRTEIVASDANIYELEMLDLFDAIYAGRPALTPLREGARSLDLALAATRSAKAGAVVTAKPTG